MNKWERTVEKKFLDLIGDGDVSHLPGAGRPLQFTNDSHTPADLRAANKIMNDHNVIPDWIASGKLLDEREDELLRRLANRRKRYLSDLASAMQADAQLKVNAIEASWRRSQAQFIEDVERYNRDALAHNLKLPPGIPHKPILRAQDLIERAPHKQASQRD